MLEVWRLEAPNFDDAEAQLHFHRERAMLLQSLVDRLGLHVTDWGDTFAEVPREITWNEVEADSAEAVREAVRQSAEWMRKGEIKNVLIAIGDGPMMPVGVVDPDQLPSNEPDPSDYVRNATNDVVIGGAPATVVEQHGATEQAERERAARLEAERLAAQAEAQRRTVEQDAQRQEDRARRERPPMAAAPTSARRPSLDGIRKTPAEVAKRVNEIRERILGQRAKPPAREFGPATPPPVSAPRMGGRGGDRGEPVAGNGGQGVARNGGGHDHPEPVAGNGGGPTPQGHSAYGHLRAPAEVVARVEFDLEVGLSKDPTPSVAGPPMIDLPPLAAEPYFVSVRIAAAGFDFPEGQAQRLDLPVSVNDAYPTTTIQLIAKNPPAGETDVDRTITAEYSIDGERLGDAIRSIRVVRSADAREHSEDELVETGVNVLAPAGAEKADLTITIRRSDRPGSVNWTFDTPHTDAIEPNDVPFGMPLPDPDAFLRNFIVQIDGAEGKEGIFSDVLALGNRVAQAIPDGIWKAIRAVATKVGKPPTILLVSEEPYVPWELAKIDPPLIADSTLPPFLAAQARVGRWVQATQLVDGRSRPSPNPPRQKDIASLGVVSGNYSKTSWTNLAHARKEASTLAKRYGARATKIKAGNKEMYNLLRGIPTADLLHFAVHGRYDPENPGKESGIILIDGQSLHANEIAARDLASAPVVFLNACQVGAGQLELGAYSGVAAAFVEAGASAVVAPLWKVDDAIAMQIAFDFYDAAAKGEPLSEVLRKQREPFADAYETKSATWMAYQLFGHPSFVVGGL